MKATQTEKKGDLFFFFNYNHKTVSQCLTYTELNLGRRGGNWQEK